MLLLASPAWVQEADDAESKDASTQEVPESADDIEIDLDDDEELYAEEDEDAFIPSEDVKFGQSIPFPTDI
jgi:hypothetical protein